MLLILSSCALYTDAPAISIPVSSESPEQEGNERVYDPALYVSSDLARQNVYHITSLDVKEFDEYTTILASGKTDEGFFLVSCRQKDLTASDHTLILINDKCRVTDTISLKLPVEMFFGAGGERITHIYSFNNGNGLHYDSPESLLDEAGAEYESVRSAEYKEFRYFGNGNLECILEINCYSETRNNVTYSFDALWNKRGECSQLTLLPVDTEEVSGVSDYVFSKDNELIVIYRLLDGTLKTSIFDPSRPYTPKKALVSRQVIEDMTMPPRGEYIPMDDGIYVLYPSDVENTGTLIGKLNPYSLRVNGSKEITPIGGDQAQCLGVTDEGELIFGNIFGLQCCKAGSDATVFMDYVNSDLLTTSTCSVMPVSGFDKFLCCYYDPQNAPHLVICDRLDPESVEESVVITIGCVSPDDSFLERIIAYNMSGTGCRIVVKDYGIYEDGMQRMCDDILSGRMCDIVCLEHMYDADLKTVAEKGMIADIGALIESDPDMSMNDFCSGVFDSARIDGKLYQIIPGFSIGTLIGGDASCNGYEDWNAEEFLEYAEETEENGSQLFDRNVTRSEFLKLLMTTVGTEWVDIEEGTCDFENPSFVSLLEYALTLPGEVDYSDETIYDYWKYYDQTLSEGNIRLKPFTVTDPAYALYSGYYALYDKPVFTGYPVSEGSGSCVSFYDNYVLKADSPLMDEAWGFIRFLLLPGEKDDNRYLPIRLDDLEARVRVCGEPVRYENRDGTYTESLMTYFYGGEAHEIPLLSEKEIREYMSFITSVDRPVFMNEDIISIVCEVAEDGKAHRRKAEKIAEAIQEAVTEYLVMQ